MDRQEWIGTYQTTKTKKQAIIALAAFDDYLQFKQTNEVKLFDSIRDPSTNDKYITLQNMINFWKSKLSANSMHNYWNFIKNWWWHNNIKTEKEALKAYVKFPKIQKEFREPLEIETIQFMVEHSVEPFKTLWLVLASSGMRIQEALSFGEHAIEWGSILGSNEIPTRILLSPSITKFATGRETYISKEAAEMLKINLAEYLKLQPASAEVYISKFRKKYGKQYPKLLEKYTNGKIHKVQIHAFKAFFSTAAAMVHDEKYSNALGGHTVYLPTYFRIPKPKREAMYLLVEPFVTIKRSKIEPT